jgi:hypothetical protein
MKDLYINLDKVLYNFFEHETSFCLINECIEQYSVFYRNFLVANFWVSNSYDSDVVFYIPLPMKVVKFIIKEIKSRNFLNNSLTEDDTSV